MTRTGPRPLLALFVLLCVAGMSACSSQPVPLAVQAGSDFSLALIGEEYSQNVGFGSDEMRANGIYDDQRGALVLHLGDPAQSGSHPLVTRMVSRISADRASTRGEAGGLGQIAALVNVPAGTPAGTYPIYAEVRRRTSGAQTDPATFPDVVVPAAAFGMSLEVLPASAGTGSPTPLTDTVFFVNLQPELPKIYPRPKLLLTLPTQTGAASIAVDYDAAKANILDVFADGTAESGVLVTWSDDAQQGTLDIDVVDPRGEVTALAVVFEPADPFGAGIPAVGDFSVASQSVYDVDGAALGGSVGVLTIR